MINEDIRHIVEAELREGEELLWAESASIEKKTDWIKRSVRSDRLNFPLSFILGILLVGAGVYNFLTGIDDIGIMKATLVNLPIFLLGGFALIASASMFRSFFKSSHYARMRPFKFYALTNHRILYFGENDELLIQQDASYAKMAKPMKRWYFPNKWKTLCLLISPVGTGWFKFTEIYFLSDFKKSQYAIENALKGTPS